jgi:ribosomal protein S27E
VFCSCDKRYSDNYLSAPVLARLWKLGLAGFKPEKSGKQTLENSEIRLIEGKTADAAIRAAMESEAFAHLLATVPKPVPERKSPVTGLTRRETKNSSQLKFGCTDPTCRHQQKVRGVRSTFVKCGYCGGALKLVGSITPNSPLSGPPPA